VVPLANGLYRERHAAAAAQIAASFQKPKSTAARRKILGASPRCQVRPLSLVEFKERLDAFTHGRRGG
jgi:hypothetical protein